MSFLSTLSKPDLMRLRAIVRRVHKREGYPPHLLSDYNVDTMIDAIGTESCQRMLEAQHGDLLRLDQTGENVQDLGEGLDDRKADVLRRQFGDDDKQDSRLSSVSETIIRRATSAIKIQT